MASVDGYVDNCRVAGRGLGRDMMVVGVKSEEEEKNEGI
jgi:hypothetical protein